MKFYVSKPEIYSYKFVDIHYRQSIFAAINTRDLTKDMVRVRSSNLWSAGYHTKDKKSKVGDMLIQFKGKDGGPDGLYIYFDIPMMVYRKFVSAPSKGHYFWKYIRNNYSYSKLSGDKKGKLKNAIN